jgi:hypothetical protein
MLWSELELQPAVLQVEEELAQGPVFYHDSQKR